MTDDNPTPRHKGEPDEVWRTRLPIAGGVAAGFMLIVGMLQLTAFVL